MAGVFQALYDQSARRSKKRQAMGLKTSDTAKFIGDIRRPVAENKFSEAHNKTLELSGRILSNIF